MENNLNERTTNEKISVIVPVYNVEAFLERCIESLIRQTYRNIEIILVDDGSTDGSGEICKKYAMRYKNIFYYFKENGGLSDARNYGIVQATGQYLAFVDSDDYVDTRMYQCLQADIEKYNADISTCAFQKFTNEPYEDDIGIASNVEVLNKEKGIRYLLLSDKYCNYAWNKLYKKDLFEKIKYPIGMKMEDLGTTYLLFNKCNVITYRPFKAYYYFQRENSIIHCADIQFYIDKLKLSMERFYFIKKIYPSMIENYNFILRTIFIDYKYFCENREIMLKIKKLIDNDVPFGMTKGLSKLQRIKFLMLKYIPRCYRRLFGVV